MPMVRVLARDQSTKATDSTPITDVVELATGYSDNLYEEYLARVGAPSAGSVGGELAALAVSDSQATRRKAHRVIYQIWDRRPDLIEPTLEGVLKHRARPGEGRLIGAPRLFESAIKKWGWKPSAELVYAVAREFEAAFENPDEFDNETGIYHLNLSEWSQAMVALTEKVPEAVEQLKFPDAEGRPEEFRKALYSRLVDQPLRIISCHSLWELLASDEQLNGVNAQRLIEGLGPRTQMESSLLKEWRHSFRSIDFERLKPAKKERLFQAMTPLLKRPIYWGFLDPLRDHFLLDRQDKMTADRGPEVLVEQAFEAAQVAVANTDRSRLPPKTKQAFSARLELLADNQLSEASLLLLERFDQHHSSQPMNRDGLAAFVLLTELAKHHPPTLESLEWRLGEQLTQPPRQLFPESYTARTSLEDLAPTLLEKHLQRLERAPTRGSLAVALNFGERSQVISSWLGSQKPGDGLPGLEVFFTKESTREESYNDLGEQLEDLGFSEDWRRFQGFHLILGGHLHDLPLAARAMEEFRTLRADGLDPEQATKRVMNEFLADPEGLTIELDTEGVQVGDFWLENQT